MPKVYLIGSLRNPNIPSISTTLRSSLAVEVFDDWYAAGPEADDFWKKYEVDRGRDYLSALMGHAARHVFEFDRHHLDTSDAAVLVLPAGKSGHLELGYMAGQGKPTYILLDAEEVRWDVMYGFATAVVDNEKDLINGLKSSLYPSALPKLSVV